jgi:16S rRNA (adenine1518-N6/adenine1519-N6)-dimethyltransferase
MAIFLKLIPVSTLTPVPEIFHTTVRLKILFRLLTVFHLPRLVAMVQKEMADRLLASAGTPEYGALTVSLSHYCTMRRAFNVGPDSFYPRPEVVSTSSSVRPAGTAARLIRKQNRIFHALVKGAFWGRRKTLYRSLSDAPELGFSPAQVSMLLEQCSIDPKRRGETLTVDEYEQLAAAAVCCRVGRLMTRIAGCSEVSFRKTGSDFTGTCRRIACVNI